MWMWYGHNNSFALQYCRFNTTHRISGMSVRIRHGADALRQLTPEKTDVTCVGRCVTKDKCTEVLHKCARCCQGIFHPALASLTILNGLLRAISVTDCVTCLYHILPSSVCTSAPDRPCYVLSRTAVVRNAHPCCPNVCTADHGFAPCGFPGSVTPCRTHPRQ